MASEHPPAIYAVNHTLQQVKVCPSITKLKDLKVSKSERQLDTDQRFVEISLELLTRLAFSRQVLLRRGQRLEITLLLGPQFRYRACQLAVG